VCWFLLGNTDGANKGKNHGSNLPNTEIQRHTVLFELKDQRTARAYDF
jgi:hypothetical protein